MFNKFFRATLGILAALILLPSCLFIGCIGLIANMGSDEPTRSERILQQKADQENGQREKDKTNRPKRN